MSEAGTDCMREGLLWEGGEAVSPINLQQGSVSRRMEAEREGGQESLRKRKKSEDI